MCLILKCMKQDMWNTNRDLCLRDVMEAREAEYGAWAHVQSLKSSLDEHNLELRVKTANESEARSQQNLAAAEAEIADMRHRLDDSKRLISNCCYSVLSNCCLKTHIYFICLVHLWWSFANVYMYFCSSIFLVVWFCLSRIEMVCDGWFIWFFNLSSPIPIIDFLNEFFHT